jgi:hypothetical protein
MPEPVGELTAATEEPLHPSIAADSLYKQLVCQQLLNEHSMTYRSRFRAAISTLQPTLHRCVFWSQCRSLDD